MVKTFLLWIRDVCCNQHLMRVDLYWVQNTSQISNQDCTILKKGSDVIIIILLACMFLLYTATDLRIGLGIHSLTKPNHAFSACACRSQGVGTGFQAMAHHVLRCCYMHTKGEKSNPAGPCQCPTVTSTPSMARIYGCYMTRETAWHATVMHTRYSHHDK